MQAVVSLLISEIDTAPASTVRAKLDCDTVERYCELYEANHEFPPVDVFEVDGRYALADGWHRFEAKRKLDNTIRAVVHDGGEDAALDFALSANTDNRPRPRDSADMRRCVEVALAHPRYAAASLRVVAEACRVSHTFVANVKRAGECKSFTPDVDSPSDQTEADVDEPVDVVDATVDDELGSDPDDCIGEPQREPAAWDVDRATEKLYAAIDRAIADWPEDHNAELCAALKAKAKEFAK